MGTCITLHPVYIPDTKVKEVKRIVRELSLEDILAVSDYGINHYAVKIIDSCMAHHTARVLMTSFLPWIASVLKDTDLDGQVLEHTCEDGLSTILLLNGEVREFDGQHPVIRTLDSAPVGKESVVSLYAKVVSLPFGRSLVISLTN